MKNSIFSKNLIFFLIISSIFYTSYAQKNENIIVFSKTAGYRHQSIEAGILSIKKLGKEHHFNVKTTENSDVLISNLKDCKAVVFLNTTALLVIEGVGVVPSEASCVPANRNIFKVWDCFCKPWINIRAFISGCSFFQGTA